MPSLNNVQKWLIVAGGFISYFLADGFTYSVGVLYSYFLSAFGMSGSTTAILPGLLYAVPQFCAILICPLLDTYGLSSGAAWGSILLSISCITSAFAQNLKTLYFTLGIVASVGLQLTYTSAIMSVTKTFENDRLFGLAIGITMCGSGIGSFSSNPFIAWLLDVWTWRQVMILLAAIVLHAVISASCFHHFDAGHFGPPSIECEKSPDADVEGLRLQVPPPSDKYGDQSLHPTRNYATSVRSLPDGKCGFFRRLSRYVLPIPSRYRFRWGSKCLPGQPHAETASDDERQPLESTELQINSGCSEFWQALLDSLRQLFSPGLWKNSTFLTYILVNGLAGAGVVIPWTFIYDHAINSLSQNGEVIDDTGISWLPAMIGIGSLVGQVATGFILSHCDSRCSADDIALNPNQSRFKKHIWSVPTHRHLFLYICILCWNFLTTLCLAMLPIENLANSISPDSALFDFHVGRLMAVCCTLVGTSYGAYYVLYPQILLDTAGSSLWAAGLGLFLFFNGVMNLIGTTLGGVIFDSTGSYRPAFLLAAFIPLFGIVLLSIEQSWFVIRSQRRSRPASPPIPG